MVPLLFILSTVVYGRMVCISTCHQIQFLDFCPNIQTLFHQCFTAIWQAVMPFSPSGFHLTTPPGRRDWWSVSDCHHAARSSRLGGEHLEPCDPWVSGQLPDYGPSWPVTQFGQTVNCAEWFQTSISQFGFHSTEATQGFRNGVCLWPHHKMLRWRSTGNLS